MENNTVLSQIGNTPLVKLKQASELTGCNIYGKAEYFNPGESVKDRAALWIIKDAEKKGLIDKNTTIIETTSGNTGFSLSMVSMVKGYDCIVAVSSKSSPDKIDMLKSMGAKVGLLNQKTEKCIFKMKVLYKIIFVRSVLRQLLPF